MSTNEEKPILKEEGNMKLTPEIEILDEFVYLIKVDGAELSFVDTAEDAAIAIDSIAAEEARRFATDNIKVTREDLNEGYQSILYRQSLGYLYNSKPEICMDITAVKVFKNNIIGPRLSTVAKPPPPPPLPPAL